MELLEITDLADQLGLPHSVARSYRDRFLGCLPTVRVGRHLRYAPEALAVMAEIDRLIGAGSSPDAVEAALRERAPVPLLTAQEATSAAAIETLDRHRSEIVTALEAVRADVAGLAGAEDLGVLHEKVLTLVSLIARRESEWQQTEATRTDRLQAEIIALRDSVGHLATGLREALDTLQRPIDLQASVDVEVAADPLEDEAVAAAPPPPEPTATGVGASQPQGGGRRPRRMGQALPAVVVWPE